MKTITTLSSLLANIAIFAVAAMLYLSESYGYSAILTLAAMISLGSWIRTARTSRFRFIQQKRAAEGLIKAIYSRKDRLLASWK